MVSAHWSRSTLGLAALLLPSWAAVSAYPPSKPASETKPAEAPKSVTDPVARQAAEKLYREVYGPEAERAAASKAAADKAAMANKLVTAAAQVEPDNAVLARLLRERAVGFAEEAPATYPLAAKLIRGVLADVENRVPWLERLAEVLEKQQRLAKPAERAGPAGELVATLQELADALVERGEFDAARKHLDRARVVVRATLKSDPRLNEALEAQTAAVLKARQLQSRLEAARKALAAKPTDSAANLEAGLCELLVAGSEANATGPLGKSGNAALAKLSEELLRSPANPLATADAYRDAGVAMTREKDLAPRLHARALRLYQAILEADPQHAEATRIRLIVAQLSSLAEPSAPKPSTAGGGFKAIHALTRFAVKTGKTTETPMVGFSIGERIRRSTPPEGGVLVGFTVTMGQFVTREIPHVFRPIYQTAAGEWVGPQLGETKGQKTVTVRARAGYAVAALKVKAGLNVDGVQLVFARVVGEKLDPSDSYESDWIGQSPGKSEDTRATNAVSGVPVLGVAVRLREHNGRDGEVIAIGLIQVAADAGTPAKK